MKKKKINLIDFKNFSPLKKIRKNMNISDDYQANFEGIKTKIKDPIWDEIKTKGLDISIEELIITKDGTLEHGDYPGQKLIVYIRDMKPYQGVWTPPKFHIYWCKTLENMKKQGRHSRYVVSQRQDGIFLLNKMKNGMLIEENLELELDLCGYCLNELKRKSKRNYTIKTFNIKDFLEEFNTEITIIPKYTEITQPLDRYSEDWNNVSYNYRKFKNWRCEKCGKDLTNDRRNLHVHHIDRDKSNINPSNLVALCVDCHEDEHPHMKALRR